MEKVMETETGKVGEELAKVNCIGKEFLCCNKNCMNTKSTVQQHRNFASSHMVCQHRNNISEKKICNSGLARATEKEKEKVMVRGYL